MTGLQKIIKKIEDDSIEKCASIIDEAEKRASALINEARSEANKIAQDTVMKAQYEADRITAVAKSSAETVSRMKYLEVKNAIINDIISVVFLFTFCVILRADFTPLGKVSFASTASASKPFMAHVTSSSIDRLSCDSYSLFLNPSNSITSA